MLRGVPHRVVRLRNETFSVLLSRIAYWRLPSGVSSAGSVLSDSGGLWCEAGPFEWSDSDDSNGPILDNT